MASTPQRQEAVAATPMANNTNMQAGLLASASNMMSTTVCIRVCVNVCVRVCVCVCVCVRRVCVRARVLRRAVRVLLMVSRRKRLEQGV